MLHLPPASPYPDGSRPANATATCPGGEMHSGPDTGKVRALSVSM